MKIFETQLQGFFDEVKAMIAMGNRSDAIDLLQANYEAVKERINAGARGMEEVALMDVIALGYMALGDLKFVATLLDNVSSPLSFYCFFNHFYFELARRLVESEKSYLLCLLLILTLGCHVLYVLVMSKQDIRYISMHKLSLLHN